MNQVEQIQETNKINRTLDKARLIATSKRVRRCAANRNIWLVGSGNPKTPKKFYCVVWDEQLDGFMCDCPDFRYNCTIGDLCCHIAACSFHEGGLVQ